MALLLCVVGLYGVVAYSVSQRTREIGIRMALRAEQATVHRMILKEAAWLAVLGIVVGLGCAVGAATLMKACCLGWRRGTRPPWRRLRWYWACLRCSQVFCRRGEQ
jgi:macrolide transport system ATP-binding/permease protein